MSNFFKLLLVSCVLFFNYSMLFAQETYTSGTFAQKMLEPTAEEEAKINAAFTVMEAVQKAGSYIESLSDLFNNQEISLPVGIKNGAYELIIQQIKFNKETGKTNIFASYAFKFKDNGQKIAFEGSVDLEGQKGLGTSGHLQLIAPVKRDLGKQASIIFKNGTKANFGCEGIESFFAKIDLIVTSDKIIPVDNAGKPTGNLLSTSFDASFHDFDNYTVSFSFNQSFTFKGLKDLIFTLKGASLDQSDLETSSMIRFPQDYFTGQNSDDINIWKGISISEASIALPAFFKKSNFTNNPLPAETTGISNDFSDRIVIALNDVLIDENGFTGYVSASGVTNSKELDKKKWDISIADFLFGINKNNLSEFGFGGDINIPPLGKNSLVPYMATFNPSTDEYEFQVNVSGDYDFPVLRSTLSLNETSSIEILFNSTLRL